MEASLRELLSSFTYFGQSSVQYVVTPSEDIWIMKCLRVFVNSVLHVCDCPGEQNPHRVPEHSDCGLEPRGNHQPAGCKNHLEVRLPTTLCSQHSSQCGRGVVRQTSCLPLWPVALDSFNTVYVWTHKESTVNNWRTEISKHIIPLS